MIPTIEYTERKRLSGTIELIGGITLIASATIPNYRGGSVDVRKQTEMYIADILYDELLKIQGIDKLYDALTKVRQMTTTYDTQGQVVVEVLEELIHELRNPKFNLKGNKE